ncbi:DNA repair protein complementing XP-C cells-like [Mercenaria mercenaria]|uniref:DNA repair protein complementing XP-C cells-like n=1 Tax=Mercenaria mercenaria TaxID=6596 RepID=UPI00234E7A0E|nr:DNA repair protein complementing XP-C cells-like [Mercenaria mercenaria]
MPRRKMEKLEPESEQDSAEAKSSGNKSRTVKKKVKTEDSADSSLNIKDTSVRTSNNKEGTGKRNRKECRKSKQDINSCADSKCLDTSVSEYFSAVNGDIISDQSKDVKKKSKKENNSSYASKVRNLKSSIGSDEGSEAEFEAVTVNYSSPGGKRDSSVRKRGSVKKSAKTGKKNTDKNEGIKESRTAKSSDKNSKDEGLKVNCLSESNKNKDVKGKKETSNRKRKPADLAVRNAIDNDVEIKKPKRQDKQLRCRQSKNKNADTEAGKVNRKVKVPENVISKKAVNKKADPDDIFTILKQTEGTKPGKVNTDNIIKDESDKSSGGEMMDVESPLKEVPVPVAARSIPKSVDHSDAMAILMHMEGPKQNYLAEKPSTSKALVSVDIENMSDVDDDDENGDNKEGGDDTDEESEWEDVEDHHGNSPKKSQLPSGPVEITLDAPVIYKKRKKGEFDLQAYFRRQINRFKREVAMDIHKVHLLCLLARCQYLNNLCKDETVQAQALSITLVTKELKLPPVKSCTESHVTRVLSWIKEQKHHLIEIMADSLSEVSTQLRVTLTCVVLLRQVGFLTRLMASLQPVPFKETSSKSNSSKKGKSQTLKSSNSSKGKQVEKGESTKTASSKTVKKNVKKNLAKDRSENVKTYKNAAKKKDLDEDFSSEGKETRGKISTVKRRSSDRKCTKVSKTAYRVDAESDNEEMSDDNDGDFVPVGDDGYDDDNDDDCNNVKKNDNKRKRNKTENKKSSKRIKAEDEALKAENISDDDFAEDSVLIRTQQLKKEPSKIKNRRALSTDTEYDYCGVDNWAEVYIEKEQKWLCVDCVSIQVKKTYEIENKATQPVSYVVGITQEGYIRDVTARYASQWLTETRKLRVESEWWEETLKPYKCPDMARDKIEDQELNFHLQQRPLPTSIGAFKSHPLYALKRHLLKFEALYPDTAVPVGYIRGEPVYARECVHTLHSRENWLKEGRAVRVGEEPYKFVKSRPKWNRPKEDPEAKDLELFGNWQTEQYIPPPAVDGKVPRNAHGNVEMFLPSMLPAGTVHLKIQGLHKIAKKLDIDCAPAMVGWDHHCGFSHPLMDGVIVCEEYKDILLAAWDEEQEIIREKEQKKREKRVYENWRKLIRGMLIKERLKKRFDLEEKPNETSEQDKPDTVSQTGTAEVTGPTVTEKANDKKHAWPQNRMIENQQSLCTVEEL